ncbi:nitroreductase family protein [Bifidobacterium biavatii]|uniref:Nitroreductase n=1 Tax=Bifidobacterium biavatii DSM 23969 TaxID=1437608 RepID=A0A086ZF84_9BIFI|nr:nitroreductase family protein [Bifidobacterium biavatii]KFI45184.1 nitroreductase [Bifidobacterium biavatii DSM 23969]
MNITEAMEARHAVRDFTDQPIDAAVLDKLRAAVAEANAQGGLDIRLVHDDTDAFGGCPTHYGRFKNVRWCFALIGHDADTGPADLDKRAGYFGERLALTAVSLGLDTGWAVLHEVAEHDDFWHLADGERMPAVIALGHGARPGRPHRSRPVEELGAVEGAGTLADAPAWFVSALEAAQLAPSALGKQPFRFTLLADGLTVRAEALEGVQSDIGLGIAKLHMELGAAAAGHTIVW